MQINVGRKHVNKRKRMRGDMLVWMIEFATKNLSLRAKNVSKYTSNWEVARVIIACYYFEAKEICKEKRKMEDFAEKRKIFLKKFGGFRKSL